MSVDLEVELVYEVTTILGAMAGTPRTSSGSVR